MTSKWIFCLFILFSNTCLAANNYFARAALVDTGYDACRITNGSNCESNRNILFRGEQPLDDTFRFDSTLFRDKIFTYIQTFQKMYSTKANLPKSLEELKQYRIVIINLLYDAHAQGSDTEYDELTHEFLYSGAVTTLQIPEQHKMYGLQTEFNTNQFSFEWWPVAFTEQNNPLDITLNLNWPDKETVPVPRSDQIYKKLNLPFLITGSSYLDDTENEAMSLRSLLNYEVNDGHPLLIFYHCVAGKDRTGAVTLSYLMQYGGYANVSPQKPPIVTIRNNPLTFSRALQATTLMGYPTPRENAQVLARAYCYNIGKQVDDCKTDTKPLLGKT